MSLAIGILGGSLTAMALEMVAWAGRHIDAIFVGCLVIIGVRFVVECVEAVSRGVERYRVLKADAALRRKYR